MIECSDLEKTCREILADVLERTNDTRGAGAVRNGYGCTIDADDAVAALKLAITAGVSPDASPDSGEAAREAAYERAKSAWEDRYNAGGTTIRDCVVSIVDAVLAAPASPSSSSSGEGIQAETYRDMHEIATRDLGYPSILEALEATPPVARDAELGEGINDVDAEAHDWVRRAYREPDDLTQMDLYRFTRWNMAVAYSAGHAAASQADCTAFLPDTPPDPKPITQERYDLEGRVLEILEDVQGRFSAFEQSAQTLAFARRCVELALSNPTHARGDDHDNG